MIRVLPIAGLALGLASLSSLADDRVMAPPPREARSDGSPAPQAGASKAKNPLETVERIIKDSNAVGDRLARTDPGKDTQAAQDKILKDIQSLIDDQENPPPKPDQNPDMNKNDQPNDGMDKKDPKNKDNDPKQNQKPNHPKNEKDKKDKNDPMPMPNGGMNEMQPQGGMNQQSGGGSEGTRERRPRQQGGRQDQKQQTQGGTSQPQGKEPGGAQANKGGQGAANDPRQSAGSGGGMLNPPPAPSLLPTEETGVKDVWGYLPDKMRQQAMQYYRQEFMPRYAKLLEHYYASLAEKNGKK